MMEMNRMCIYPKDVQRITGRTERYGRKLLKRIKDHYSKDQHQLVSITEFCKFTGLNTDDVKRYF